MVSRLIYSKIWTDEFFTELTPSEKLLFFYFLTNEKINIIHIFELPLRTIMFDTGLTAEDIENAKNKFQAKGKLHFFKNYVYITNAWRYQEFGGVKNDIAKQKQLRQLPKEVLAWYYSIRDTSMIGVSIPSITVTEIVNEIKTETEIKEGEGYAKFLRAKEELVDKSGAN